MTCVSSKNNYAFKNYVMYNATSIFKEPSGIIPEVRNKKKF